MHTHNIAAIPGDGVGQEIIPAAIEVLHQLASRLGTFQLHFVTLPWGSAYYLEHGVMMPDDGLNTLLDFDAIYFGTVGSLEVPDHISLNGLRLKICQGFDQYVCLRPTELLPGITSPLRDPGPIDFMVVRENTEGEYLGAGGVAHPGHSHEVAVETAVFTRHTMERVMRYAFELAQSRKRYLINVTKSNAQRNTLRLWDDVFTGLEPQYPDVRTERVLVDAMAARMIQRPASLDVLVASNLFGDILTDVAGAIAGSLGLAPSVNLDPERRYPSMFEPIHGSAFDIMGQGIANPIGTLLCGAMMLEHLGETEAGQHLRAAIKMVTANGDILTPDVGGTATMEQVCTAVVKAIHSQ